MASHPKIALIGRPNVGKSALFNRIAGKRIAVVHEIEGVTRDRLYTPCEHFGQYFTLIDTGGIEYFSHLPFREEVRMQAHLAATEADVIILVVDGRVGITESDHEVVKALRGLKKPIVVAVNKIDSSDHENLVHQFHELGLGTPQPVSAIQGHYLAELVDLALSHCSQNREEIEEKCVKVALIGRPNVGKSTLLNCLLDEERSIVSEKAGTTRDSIDVNVEINGSEYTLIDTAGIRRKPKEKDVIEKFAALRTELAISRADICVLLLDAEDGLTAQDKKIACQIEAEGKGCVLVFNKWDKIKGVRMEHCEKQVRDEASFLNHCPILFTSALTSRNVDELFKVVAHVHEQMHSRVTTGQLNKFVERTTQLYHPPMLQGGRRLRIYYLTQVATNPPRFVLFINNPQLMLASYKRYLLNAFRKAYAFTGCPVRIDLKRRKQRADISRYIANR